ncbi:hypothetical protein VP01_2279g3, partial [Puccinia sorghi]
MHRCRIQENSNDSDHEVLPSTFEDLINLYMEKLYKKHLPNKKKDSQFPVFIDPCNPNRYILLKMGAVQTWACALNTGTPGVLINSPPESFQYLNIDSKKQKNHFKQTKSNSPYSDDSQESGIKSDSHTIGDVTEILEANNIFNFKLFKYKSITHNHMKIMSQSIRDISRKI